MKTTQLIAAMLVALAGPGAFAQPPVITLQPTNSSVSPGGTAHFRTAITSTNGPVTCQWWFKEAALDTNANPSTAKFTLSLTNVTLADVGPYFAVVSDASDLSATSQVATLTVDPTFFQVTDVPFLGNSAQSPSPYWVDFDGDGWLDVVVPYFVGSSGGGKPMEMYRNNRDGTFSAVTNLVTQTAGNWSGGLVFADFDGDGHLDFFITQAGAAPILFLNHGSNDFSKVVVNRTTTANAKNVPGVLGACADYDGDGWVDIATRPLWGSSGAALLHNVGGGRFEVLANTPVNTGASPYSEGMVWTDYDGDGFVDLMVTTSPYPAGVKDLLFRNQGDGTFVQITSHPLVDVAGADTDAAWGDYDNDGLLDVYVPYESTTQEPFPSTLYHNLGNGQFEVDPHGPVLNGRQQPVGATWGDYDNDGYLDLVVGQYAGRNRLFHNNGDGTFSEVLTGSPVNGSTSSYWGAYWADYNNDGFLDLLAQPVAGAAPFELYRNNLPQVGNTNHWLKVQLRGVASSTEGIGAKVRVKATIRGKTVWQVRQVGGQTWGQELVSHFGLGDATTVETVRVEWPSGNVQEWTDIQPNQLLKLAEWTSITPVTPTASLNGSIQLARSSLAGASYQWRFDGIEIEGQTNRTLSLSNLVASQQGRYSVVVSNATTIATNYAYLHVDTTFTKITEGAIVNDPGNSYIPAWGDYNGDGWLDLFVANGANEGPAVPFLYRNDQHGGFVRVGADEVGELATNSIQAVEGSWADYDNDGNLDLFIGAVGSGKSQLYHNEGNGRFRRITEDVGINRLYYPAGSAWGDYDKDGFVDLYLGRMGFDTDMLWRNVGGTTFALSRTCPFVSMSVNYGAWGDADNDGDLDLYVPNMADGANAFYRNQGSGIFKYDASAGLGSGGGGAVMPVWADFNNDGYLDLFVTRNSTPCYYFQNNRDGTFKEITTGPHTQTYGLSASAGDYDNDGYLDLFITRGQGDGTPSLLLHNQGDGTFAAVSCGSLTSQAGQFTGCAWADYDNDGALDLIVTTIANQKNVLFHNNGNSNAWLIVRPIGTVSNRSAIGAKVITRTAIWGQSTLQVRQIGGGSLGEPRAHFGLGNATTVATLRLEWPSGIAEEFYNVAPRQILTIVEPSLKGAFGTDGSFHLQMSGNTNRTYQISTSADLVNWTALTNCPGPGPGGTIEVSDPAAGQSQRFYRLEAP